MLASGSVLPAPCRWSVQEEKKLTPGSERSALGQFNAEGPKVPRHLDCWKTIGTSAASAAGSRWSAASTRDSRFQHRSRRDASDERFRYSVLGDRGGEPIFRPNLRAWRFPSGWWDGASGSVGEYAVPGIGADGYIDALGDGVGIGVDAASSSVPVIGPAISLARGNVGGAAGALGWRPDCRAHRRRGRRIPGGGGCFITEATMAGLGVQDDDAEPLKVLRAFRDQVLCQHAAGQQMIQEYEAIAPLVVQAVQARPDAMTIFKGHLHAVHRTGGRSHQGRELPQALQIYAAMIAAVVPFAQEAMGDMDDMEEGAMGEAGEFSRSLGDDAAEVAQNPQMAQQAAPIRRRYAGRRASTVQCRREPVAGEIRTEVNHHVGRLPQRHRLDGDHAKRVIPSAIGTYISGQANQKAAQAVADSGIRRHSRTSRQPRGRLARRGRRARRRRLLITCAPLWPRPDP